MNIEQKLAYSERGDRVYFFRERMFLKLYGLSLYIGVTELKLPVSLELKRYKLLENKAVLQASLLSKKLNGLEIKGILEKNYGYTLKGQWSLNYDKYKSWYKEQLMKLTEQEAKEQKLLEIEKNLDQGLKALWLTEGEYKLIKSCLEDSAQNYKLQRLVTELRRKIASSCA